VLMDRMDSLEKMVMTQIQRPDDGTTSITSSSDMELAIIPDAHLGSQ
jgi:hypothetical protein